MHICIDIYCVNSNYDSDSYNPNSIKFDSKGRPIEEAHSITKARLSETSALSENAMC